MKETRDLIRAWRALPPGTPAILATVVATRGSTYRRPGARMLITEDAWLAGSISGGCLESDVVHTAWLRTEDGPALVEYDSTADDDILLGFGLGCSGSTTVLMERLPEDGGILPTLERLVVEGGETETIFHGEVILRETIEPPPELIVFGAGHDAIPLVRIAAGLGWRVIVVDGRSTHARDERFPEAEAVVLAAAQVAPERITIAEGTAVVVMTHGYLNDIALLRWLLPSPAAYIGQLGPAARRDRLLGELGFVPTEAQLARFHAPIGLDLGAQGPDEIALAIVAEIQAFRRGRGGGSLRGNSLREGLLRQ